MINVKYSYCSYITTCSMYNMLYVVCVIQKWQNNQLIDGGCKLVEVEEVEAEVEVKYYNIFLDEL